MDMNSLLGVALHMTEGVINICKIHEINSIKSKY
ncbi:hypothetical protein PsalMR5_01249 [Piscirickettsia salmonis]|nr:hypothetical protein PsalSR1_01233 [Piscirickettsia salmonis]QGP60283.1 hypothetical protein PsalBI1_02888 [Piscirickettsia salmonis]QGP63393.1 hypothetical protein PsalMR5_01249 [Piscirickettsia salmonis]